MENQPGKFNPSTSLGQKFRVWWDEDNQIIRAKFWGDQDEASALGALEEIQKILADKPDKTLLLIDLTKAGSVSSGARKRFIEIAKLEKIKKEAQFGMGTVVRIVTSFVIKFAGVTNSKYFATEEEALRWLKEQ